jgi:serine phosphatase RsbU (regulator of sigma subunit)
MSDQDAGTTTPETAATATEDTSNAPTGPQDAAETSSDDQDNGKGPKGGSDALKADLARERRERQKLQNELKKLQDRDLSELERAQRQATEASKELEQLRAESLRQRVALKAGIPAEHIHRLQGSTEQELAADAAELAKLLTPKAPRPDPSQGSRAGEGPRDMNDLIRSAARRNVI